MSAFRKHCSRSMAYVSTISLLVAAGVLTGCQGEPSPPQGPEPVNVAEDQTLADFEKRVEAYADMHKRIESSITSLPEEATPEQIDRNQRELGRLLTAERAGAKQGDLFTPDIQTLAREHLARMFAGKDGDGIKASVMDENPVDMAVHVNQRYPDEIPMSTMPPEVLQLLPKVPEELEYRFVGRHLVMLDAPAHIIADYIPNVIPE